jgi:hypothetical protein
MRWRFLLVYFMKVVHEMYRASLAIFLQQQSRDEIASREIFAIKIQSTSYR